ncbi:hydroxypyruvate isomerase family protein [Pseudonocardia sp. TRM90224]|uniref:hydroxypyruvate isomerase family protein n=1 Tax=Pseudonocardia sp. TRM90224 TaxID=2812678 RepID=UPI001E3D3CB1|nr:TIM barrel protein [Pseudonocardia sp. TRM90224]
MTALRFAANLKWLFTELPFEERFDAAAAAGFTAVEYSSPYGFPAAELRRRLDGAGLRQVLINTPGGQPGTPTRNGSACIPDLVPQFRRELDLALEYAGVLGSGLVHVTGGIRPEGVPAADAFATYVTNIGWAAERAAGSGVRLVLEALNQRDAPGFVLTSIEQAAGVVRAVGVDHVRLLFDVYHCQVQQGSVTTRMQELWPLVGHIQVADAPTRTEPGTGELNWRFVFDRIRALDYAGWIGCEYRPANGTLAGLSWLADYT